MVSLHRYPSTGRCFVNNILRHDRRTCKRHEPPSSASHIVLEYEPSLEAGFQIATLQGPLCAEPVQGMAYLVESLQANEMDGQDTEGTLGLLS
jgi:ribosome assembly protein 1